MHRNDHITCHDAYYVRSPTYGRPVRVGLFVGEETHDILNLIFVRWRQCAMIGVHLWHTRASSPDERTMYYATMQREGSPKTCTSTYYYQ